MQEWKSSKTTLAVTAAALITVFAFSVATWIRLPPDTRWVEIQQQIKMNSLYERDELKYKILGRTADEVIAIAGTPARTADGLDDGNETWYYLNPPTRKFGSTQQDYTMWVKFHQHQVVGVLF